MYRGSSQRVGGNEPGPEGFITFGMNPVGIGPNSSKMINALSKLKWMVVGENYQIETATFWKAPKEYGGPDPSQIQTEVFQLPCSGFAEKDGSFINSARWIQWKWKAIDPPGEAKTDQEILSRILLAVRELYKKEGGALPEQVLNVTWNYTNPVNPDLAEVLKEINGKAVTDIKDKDGKIIRAAGQQLDGFAQLQDDGSTMCGNWLHSGVYTEAGNNAQRRSTADPNGLGMYHNWAFSWPANRRIMYNRASADADGKPWDPKRAGITWDGTKWVGDVPDYPATMNPRDPNAYLPFIMNGEGVGRLFSNSMIDGPFPEHYEPVESPVANPLHASNSASPVAFLYDQAAGRPNRFGTAAEFPYIATSYRLTEHEHYVTQHVPHLVQLQPEPFVEIPEELASSKGIKSGDQVRVSSKRGKVEVLAIVTKRLGPLTVAGQKVYQIGIPIHWGDVGISADADPTHGRYWLANALTPFVGDANSRTPEFKAFLVNLEKM